MNSIEKLQLQCENEVLKEDYEKLYELFMRVRKDNIRLIVENRRREYENNDNSRSA